MSIWTLEAFFCHKQNSIQDSIGEILKEGHTDFSFQPLINTLYKQRGGTT